MIAGTGIVNDAHEPLLGLPYQLLKWTLAARLSGTKVYFISVGVDGLSGGLQQRMLLGALRLGHYRSYRDARSRSRVAGLLANAAWDPVTPDIAFGLPRALVDSRHGQDAEPLGVAVGLFGVEESDAALDQYVDTIGRFVLWLLERGYQPRLVVGDLEYDDRVLERLTAWLASRKALARVIHEPISSFEDLLDQLSQTKLVVATRFHNVLLSLWLAKPVISVSHMEKNDALMEAIGMGRFAIPLKGLHVELLIDRFIELNDQAPWIRSVLREKGEAFRGELERQYGHLFGSRASDA